MRSEITILRAMGIILVVFGHSDIGGQNSPAFYSFLEKFVYSFHMPLFMFISGFVFFLTKSEKKIFNFDHFIRKKIYRLLLPSFVVLTIAFFVRAILSHFKSNIVDTFSLINYLKMFFLKEYLPIEFFWFIFTLFNIFLFSRLILYCVRNKLFMIIISLLLISLNLICVDVKLFYIGNTCSYFLYFWLGCIWCDFIYKKEGLFNFLPEKSHLPVATCFLFFLIFFNTFFQVKPSVSIACAVSGISMCFFLAIYLKKFRLPYFIVIGEYSYQIFLLSWFFHRIVESIGFKMFNLSFWITFPVSLTIAIAGPILLSKIVERKLPKMKFLFGLN